VVGFLRPAILVPAGWFLNLPPDHVEALLAHELAHVLRHDYLVNLLQSLLEVLFFYHPGLWWLSGRIRQERELACDAFATRLTGDPLPLAQALTFLERRGLAHANLEPALAAHGGSLMERIRQLLLPAPRTSSTPVFGAVAVMALILASGLHLAAQSPAPAPGMPTNMELPKGVKVDWDSTHLYLHLHNAKDVSGKVIPHAWTMDLVAREVPLNQVWATFQDTLKTTLKATGQCQSFSPRDAKVEGPKISLNLKGATPAEVQAALEGLAKENGVAPYEAPAPHTLGSFTIGKRTAEDKTTRYSLHARQVSVGYLPELLAEARRADKSVEFASGSMSWDRNKDTHSSPKVDAIFEDLPLAELEKRVNALIESAK